MSRSTIIMSHVSDLRLEDLPDVEPYLINKLKRAGIQSLLDLAVSIPHELAEGGGGNYIDDDNNTAITSDIETISQLVGKAKKALIDSGALSKEFCTAEEFLERRNSLVRFTTGSVNLDSFLKGGIESQAITEIAGEFGSGKSQLCHTLCVTAVANNTIKEKKERRGGDFGRNNNNNSIIFIDTENTFRPERIHQIAEGRGLEPEEIMKKVFVCKIYNSAHLEAIIKNLGKSIEHYKAKLVIIDSIISLHRAEFPGRETLAERQQRLNVMLHKLIRLAEVYNVAVVLTNQVQSKPDDFFGGGDPTRAAGGNIMGHASTYRIFLRKAGRDRIAIMVDSPHHAYGQTRFTISEKGIQDTEQEDKESTGNSGSNKYSESGW